MSRVKELSKEYAVNPTPAVMSAAVLLRAPLVTVTDVVPPPADV